MKRRRPQWRPLVMDTSDEVEWEHFVSENAAESGKIKKLVSGRVINRCSPPESDSGLDSRRIGPKFTHVDVNLEKGMGDQPFPHVVPIVGLRSSANSSRQCSVGSEFRSTRLGASFKASSRSLSAGMSARDSSYLPTARSSRFASSTRLKSSVRSRSLSESTDETISPKTHNLLSPINRRAEMLPQDKSSRTSRSSMSVNFRSNEVCPRSGRERGQPPGFWINISEKKNDHSNNVCVWAITDPPQLPAGIAWEKVTSPTFPAPTPKEGAVESQMPKVDDEGNENEPQDASLDTSVNIIPELIPSLDPSTVVPKTVIRKIMMLPENVGYPGFCEPRTVELHQRKKKISSKKISGENKSIGLKCREQSKSKNRPNSSKEQPQNTVGNVHKVTKKNGITPFSWRAGVKCVRRELGPWKTKVSTNEEKGNQENSEISEKLNNICKFVEKTENKISEYKSWEAKPDKEFSEVHLFHRECGESEILDAEKCGESVQNKESNVLIDEQKSLEKQQLIIDLSSENRSKIANKKNSGDCSVLNLLVKCESPSTKSSRRLYTRHPGVKSAHNLNNAFIADSNAVLPRRASSQFNLPSYSKGGNYPVSPSKCALRHYDPMAIKEYIRIQKKQRHVKLLKEKEMKKIQDENRRVKLQELRSKSRELVEESLKKKAKFVNKDLEFLQMFGKQFVESALNVDLKEKIEDVYAVGNNKPFHNVSAEKKSSTQCDSTHSNVAHSQNSVRIKMPNKLDIELPFEIKLDSTSIPLAEYGVPPKSVQHVALQTDEDFFKLLSDDRKNSIFCETANIEGLSAAPLQYLIEPKLPICVAKAVETSFSEKSDSSRSDSDKIVIDKELGHSIQREMKKLLQNVYVLEKHRMIGVVQETGAMPSTSAKRVLAREFLEIGNLLKGDLNNKKISTLGSERHSIIRNDSPLEAVFPVHNQRNRIPSSMMSHSIVELPARPKPSVNNLVSENKNGYNILDAGHSSVNMQNCLLTGRERKMPPKNNISSNLLGIKQNYTSMSDSIISEGPLSENELENVVRLKELETTNVQENSQSKNLDENRENEIPLWLKKPPMESHPFNFISAVKMKLKRFLEEQNKNILTDISSNVIQIPRPLDVHGDEKKEGLEEKHEIVGDVPEVNYESDFEPSAVSGSGPSQNDEKVSAANSSDLDTATEDILPTDEVPQHNIPFPNNDLRKEAIVYHSDNISELSRNSASLTSNQSHFSDVNHQLMAPNFTLSRLGGNITVKIDKETDSRASTAELENIKEIPKSYESEVLSVLSLPSAKLSCKSDGSSYGSCKTDLSIASKSGLVSEDFSSNKPDSTLIQRKHLREESTVGFNEVNSLVSTMLLDKSLSDRNHISSKDGLSHNAASSEICSPSKVGIDLDGRLESAPPSSFPQQLSGLKEINDKHSLKLAEMEMKAFEHRLEMEIAFENERQKLELALEEAKKTVIDSKLEATKLISNAAVELVKSQAEATKANAEATRHISEAKVIDALKLETISAQSASAAAFAAVQAAIKQLQSFKKFKQLPNNNPVTQNSFSSTVSEAASSTSGEKLVNSSGEGESILSTLAKGIVEKMKLADKAVTVEKIGGKSINKMNKEDNKILDAVPEDSSLKSISENISEPEYSSKFDETASEGELKSALNLAEVSADFTGSYSTASKIKTENKKVAKNLKKQNGFVIKNLDANNVFDISLGSPQLNEESSCIDHDSFTKFSLSMFQQLMREEEMRAQHQQALLKLREEALIDKTKAEMILLELKKKQYKGKGREDAVSSIRKKQRGLLLRLKLERDEILRLKKSHKTASLERRMMLTQQQHIVRMRISTQEIMNKLHTKKLPSTPKAIRAMGFIGSALSTGKSNVELNTEESALESESNCSTVPEEIHLVDVAHSDVSLPTVPVQSSHASLSDSGSQNGQKKNVGRLEKHVVHCLDDLERNKKFLSETERNLIHRRQAVEELIVWRKRLEQEEERVKALESQTLCPSKAQQVIGTMELSGLKDRSTSPLQFEPLMDVKLKEDVATSVADISLTHSSILEDGPNESQKLSFSAVDEIDANSKKNDSADESLKSSASASVITTEVSATEQSKDSEVGTRKVEVDSKSSRASIPSLNDKDESKNSSLNITIRNSLTSYITGRQKRSYSSGSDESAILSQNETASEQSDIEGKICALQEQLRRRKMEAELLKREQKRCRRERLKAKEQSLIKQIQAYDQYIQKARVELEQEYESPTISLVKPQIKQPRVAERKKVFEDHKDALSEIPEKVAVTESEIIEKVSSESQNEVKKHSEKLSPLESIPESAEKGSPITLEQDYSEQVCDSIEPSLIKNDSCSSLSEVLEEIQIPTEELPASDDRQGSISRESSVETTIESPTKQDVVEFFRDSDRDDGNQKDILSKSDKDVSLRNDSIKDDTISTIIEAKFDKYDEDTFESLSGSNMKASEISVNKLSGRAKSPEGQESDEIMGELCSEKHDGLPSGALGYDKEMDEMNNEDNGIVGNHSVEDIQGVQAMEVVSENSASLPSHIFKVHSAAHFNPNETYTVSEDKVQSVEKAEEITQNILRDLLDESVIEAETLIIKNSACTLMMQVFNDKVKQLIPLYEVESYEEVLEQKLEDFEPEYEELVNIVSVNSNEDVHAEDIEARDVDFHLMQRNTVLSDLLQYLLDDATTEILFILARRESFFRQERDQDVMLLNECTFQSTTNISRETDVIKRVQQIMLESSLSQVSPREKSRPQDLMITTYDVLSPDSSNSSSPVLGQPDTEMAFVQEEKYSQKSPIKYTSGKGMQFLQVEHSGGLVTSAAAEEPSGAENDTYSQEWFEEDFGLNSTLREVEEIQLQRLQIEREIEQLQLAQAKEQQQKQYPYNFYIREIPNKPPPPYTPPEETPRISASFAGPISPLGTTRDPSPKVAIPTDQEEIANFVRTAAGKFHDAWRLGERLDSVEHPLCSKLVGEEEDSYQNYGSGDGDLRRKSRRAYSQFLFDLSRQLVDELLDNVEGEKFISVPTRFGSKNWRPSLPLPSRECFTEEVKKQALVILRFIPRETRDNFMFSWTVKKRDQIEEIIMREMQEEEKFWTNFDEEEKYIKEQIAESLFELLLVDTTKAVAMAYERRVERLSEE